MAENREHAHELIEKLRASQIPAAIDMLESLLDPVAQALASAPKEAEPLSADGENALNEAQDWSKRNPGIPHKEVLAELGITKEEIDRFQEPK